VELLDNDAVAGRSRNARATFCSRYLCFMSTMLTPIIPAANNATIGGKPAC